MASFIVTLALGMICLFAVAVLLFYAYNVITEKKRKKRDKDGLFPAKKKMYQSVMRDLEQGEDDFEITGGDKIGDSRAKIRLDDQYTTPVQKVIDADQWDLENKLDVMLGQATHPIFIKKGTESDRIKSLKKTISQQNRVIDAQNQKIYELNDTHHERDERTLKVARDALKTREQSKQATP